MEPVKLADLPEGKKFWYSDDKKITYLKLVQPIDSDWRDLEILSDACWVVILDNQNDTHPMVAVGRLVSLNSNVSVREMQ